ncbi:MAG: glycosyltransferase family 39 protein [Thermoflexales bacterium]|nr:glycosyltransferase family 39 protein [Thermoflexales bacterium]
MHIGIAKPRVSDILVALAAALALAGVWAGPPALRSGAGVALLWLVPAASWALAWPGESWAESLMLGCGLAFVANGLLTLGLHFLPGPFPTDKAGLAYLLAAVVPYFASRVLRWRQTTLPDTTPAPSRAFALGLGGLLLVAALARLPHLGYSEFQGDEAVIMRRAALALAGDDGQLFLHQKGPVEILMPMSLWALTGRVDETQARLPFALAGLLAVAAIAQLAARCFDLRAGLLAGFIVAINGFLVAFARIVQYQNVVVAMGALGLLALAAYAQKGRLAQLVAGAALLAYGLLAHYDTVLFVPAALWLLGARLAGHRRSWPRELGRLALALVVGAAILALFYLPYITHPNFAKTFAYLSGERLGSGGPLYNNTGRAWVMSTFYNSTYYVAGLLIFLGVWIGFQVSGFRSRVSGLVSTMPALLYFAVPFLFYLFLVFDPRTHVYTFYPGAALLAAAAASRIWERAQTCRSLARALAMLGLAWYAVCAAYIGLVFVNHAPEYKREWPASQSRCYPTTFEELPLFGFFGFPYRAGWKAIDTLYAQGVLDGTYASNEEPAITTWYVRSGTRSLCQRPDAYIIAEHVQDEVNIDREELERDYHLAAQVTVAGRPKLYVYRHGAAESPVSQFRLQDLAPAFDQGATIAAQLPAAYSGTHPVGRDLGNVARLLGYDVSHTSVVPGDVLRLTLYWQALDPTGRNYQVFTHLVNPSGLVAQHDGAPACAMAPTSGWEPGQVIRDEHDIPIGADAPPGAVQLVVGMYDLITLDRLAVAGTPGDALSLAEIEIGRR